MCLTYFVFLLFTFKCEMIVWCGFLLFDIRIMIKMSRKMRKNDCETKSVHTAHSHILNGRCVLPTTDCEYKKNKRIAKTKKRWSTVKYLFIIGKRRVETVSKLRRCRNWPWFSCRNIGICFHLYISGVRIAELTLLRVCFVSTFSLLFCILLNEMNWFGS